MRSRVCLLAALGFLAACHGPGQEAGDDPTRNNEGPGQGRPLDMDEGTPTAQQPADQSPADNGRKRGTLDGSSDEATSPSGSDQSR
jgi:hypothetical protein